MLDETLLKDRLETSFNSLPPVPGRLEHLDFPGIQGRITNLSHPLANIVTATRWSESEVESNIETVCAIFRERGVTFGWAVGPNTLPSDLGSHLEAVGLTKGPGMAALIHDDLGNPIRSNQEVVIREVTATGLMELRELVSISFGMPTPVIELFFESISRAEGCPRFRIYAAALDGQDVSWALSCYLPGEPIVLLGGASTIEEHRGRGVYTSLVARRFADAHADGMRAAIIQAVQTTSAPICRKLGFRDLGPIDMYIGLTGGASNVVDERLSFAR